MNQFFNFVKAHGIRTTAALGLVGLTIALGVFNVRAWWADGLYILAVLAAFFELIGLVFAVMVEDAVRAKRFDRAFVALAILAGCAAFNTVGGHRAWEAAMRPRMETETNAAQAALDRRRGELQLAAARAQEQIDRVPMPVADSYTSRQREARETWEMLTSDARARRDALQAQLDRLPVVAEVAPPFRQELVWAFLTFLEVCKALGLWSLGLIAARNAAAGPKLVVDNDAFDASEAARRLVAMRKDRQGAA